MRTAIPLNSPVLPGIAGARVFALLAVLATALGAAQLLAAQAPAAAAPSSPAHKPVHRHKRPAAASAATPAEPPAAQALPQAKPPVPEAPLWPANEKPAQAAITWDSQGLRIDAQNSSLQQILDDVSTVTGAKVEGFGTDERIFGAFGPGQARNVLSELLQGTGYNVLMIGDQGQGTPRQIVLSSRNGAATPSSASPAPTSDEDADPDEQPVFRPPGRPNFGPPRGPHGPEQYPPDMQREQHQQPGQPPQPENPQPQ